MFDNDILGAIGAQSMGWGLQGSGSTPQQLQNAYNNAQAQAHQQFSQYAQQQSQRQMMDWVLDGTPMTLMEFADTIWPEPCADKTHFILKFSKGD